jgi:hypothetical protein
METVILFRLNYTCIIITEFVCIVVVQNLLLFCAILLSFLTCEPSAYIIVNRFRTLSHEHFNHIYNKVPRDTLRIKT